MAKHKDKISAGETEIRKGLLAELHGSGQSAMLPKTR
jgi:hypothetical protein